MMTAGGGDLSPPSAILSWLICVCVRTPRLGRSGLKSLRENLTRQTSVFWQNPLGTGRVPQVRQPAPARRGSVPGPKMRCFDCFYLPGQDLPEDRRLLG